MQRNERPASAGLGGKMLKEWVLPNVKIENSANNSAKIVIEPLNPGYGVTLGNSIRRVLLTSLSGAAITQVKIKGASHEFSTIPGVKEDAIELLMNLKQIKVKSFVNEPVTLEIKGKGAKVTGADILPNSNVEIVSKDALIATLDGKTGFEAEVVVEKGRGYETAEEREGDKPALGTIALDAIYSPVTHVAYNVSQTRVGKTTNLDKLELDIETDGSVTPEDAIKQASAILVEHFNIFSQGEKMENVKHEDEEQGEGSPKKEEISKLSIEELDLSARTLNALIANNIKTVSGLLKVYPSKVKTLKGLGKVAITELDEKLDSLGILEKKED